MVRKQFSVIREPVGPLYRRLIQTAVAESARAYVVTRVDERELTGRAAEILAQLRSEEIVSRASSEWPGTKLLDGKTATVREYRCSARLAEMLTTIASRLYDWIEPDLPEDLGFVRSDGSPFLATIAHERDAFLVLTDDEASRLISDEPAFSGMLGPADGDFAP